LLFVLQILKYTYFTKKKKATSKDVADLFDVENTGFEPVTSCLPARGLAYQIEVKQYLFN